MSSQRQILMLLTLFWKNLSWKHSTLKHPWPLSKLGHTTADGSLRKLNLKWKLETLSEKLPESITTKMTGTDTKDKEITAQTYKEVAN